MKIYVLMSFLLVSLYSTGSAAPCDGNWVQHQNFCFLFSGVNATWHSADAMCRSLPGATLARPYTQDIHAFILDVIKAEPFVTHDFWFDLNANIDPTTYVYTDFSAPKFTAWFGNEPDNLGVQNCTRFWAYNFFLWDNEECGATHRFICQKSIF